MEVQVLLKPIAQDDVQGTDDEDGLGSLPEG